MKVVLHLTKDCNLRCAYCYAPSKSRETMALDIARKGVDLAIRHSDRYACVSFFGGEPLLKFELVREIARYAEKESRRAGLEMNYRLSTNGTLFDEDKLRFCRDHGIVFAVSLDGDRLAHDAHRKTSARAGSFDAIDRMLDLMLRYNPRAVFTSVITPETAGRLHESLEYMWGRGVRNVIHQPAYSYPGWRPGDMAVLEASYRRLAAFYLEKHRRGEPLFLSLFDEKFRFHIKAPAELGRACDFGTHKFSVAPDGRLFPCVQFVSDRDTAADFCIGHVDTGFTARREELVAENRKPRAACRSCEFLGRCANYCGCTNWQTTGRVDEVPGILCAHERMLIPIADEVGETLWKEKNPLFLKKHYGDADLSAFHDFD